MEELGFTKLKLLSDYIFHYISNKVKKETKLPLVKTCEFIFFYDKDLKKENMRVDCTHNNYNISFIVAYEQETICDVDKHKKEFIKELKYVANFLVCYISNGYKHP